MADSTGHKVPKSVEKHKISNMINRTTSESLRVGDSDKILNHPTSLSSSTTLPRKKNSFQITSVTVGAHMSNDGGDDSADDLDESHTEDISDVIDTSRVTDIENETPSYSEDTFSKDDVFFNSSTSLGSAPVIPTSSQYGLAIVSTPEGCGNILNNSLNCGNSLTGNELHVSVTDSVINLGLVGSKHLDGEMRDLHAHPGRNERFKVVKIESTEPFKRGRWMCMDYLDHTMSQQQQQQQTQNNLTNAARLQENMNEVATVNQCTGTDSGISVTEHTNYVSAPDDQVPVMDQGNSIGTNKFIEHQNLVSHAPINMTSVQTNISPGQTMQFNTQQIQPGVNSTQSQIIQQAQSLTTVPQNQQNLINTNHHQSLQPQQMQQVMGNSNLINQQPTPVQNQQPQHQPMSQPLQQIQQGVHMQHIIPLQQQSQNSSNIQQQFQQQQPPTMHQQIPQPSHQQNIQQQPVLHQQQPIQQHITQPIQHQHAINMQPQNQGPVSQPLIQGQQQTMQQVPHSQQLHQMQPGQSQHIQHPSLQQHSVPGVSCPQLQQTSQPSQQVYHPSSQPIIQPVMGTQPNLIPQQQTQYFTNTQPLQAGSLGAQVVSSQPMPPPNTLQPQPSSSVNVTLQQSYPITSVSQQQQQQQMQGVHPGAPTSLQHAPSSQMLSGTIQMAPVNSVSVGSNLQIPPTQCTVLSPQASGQGGSLVQQQCYVSQPGAQPIVSNVASTQIIGGSQTLSSSAVNIVPSTTVLDNTSTFTNDTVPNDQMIQSATLLDSLVDPSATASGEEMPPVEDAESLRGLARALATTSSLSAGASDCSDSPLPIALIATDTSASGTSAVAIDNKIEQAMDLVKSHLMFAVREEVEVLKEKIAELMDRINQLEVENTILKANASQETLAQLSSSVQPSMNNAP